MKVIDLLNKIANGEEVPKKIRYQADSHKKDLFTYNEYTGDYEREIGLNLFVYLFMKERITGFLNDEVEVEIIEEETEEYKKIEELFFMGESEHEKVIMLKDKLNEVINYINKEKEND